MSIRPGYLATSALMLLAMLAASAHLRAADSVVAKIVATRATGRTTSADVRVYQGTLVAGEVDILSPGGKATATLALPKGKGQATAGETVTVTLTVSGRVPPTDALVVERGAYADYAAAVVVVSGPPAPAANRPTARRVKVAACPFTPVELKSTLGLEFTAGVASPEMPYPGGARLTCRYPPVKTAGPALAVNVTLMDDPAQGDSQAFFSRMAGKMEPVPNDPDKAVWQFDQVASAQPVLYYARQGAIVELRVTVDKGDPRYTAIRQGLARLHRLP